MVARTGEPEAGPTAYADRPNRSPWIAQLAPDRPPRPLGSDATADLVVVGAGIAGIATAFFALRAGNGTVVLVERDRVARGATGRNAGQLTTYFERPLSDIADEYGWELAAEAQRGLDDAHDLLDVMVGEAAAGVRVERFTGHMGMFNRHHLEVHLRCMRIRERAGLQPQACVVSEEAEFLSELPGGFAGAYSVVPQARVRELLQVDDDRYRAVLSARAGCANSGLLCQQVLDYMQRRHASRFLYADCTDVQRVVVGPDQATVHAGGRRVTAGHVVLCTNGFVDHVVVDDAGSPIRLAADQRITGRVAYMSAFVEDTPRTPAAMSYIRNTTIGGDTPYVYVTRRTYDRTADTVTLTCMGGPEYPFDDGAYQRDAPFPGDLLQAMDEEVRPFAQPARPPGRPYDFHWHGLMGYNGSGLRVVGAHPGHPRLLYNLGCNGVGFLPSIYGGHRLAQLLAGRPLRHAGPIPRLPTREAGRLRPGQHADDGLSAVVVVHGRFA
ncbi:MAG: NAD(P)/FAD-dependent oxidoreductase [Verrucomicrobiota bacterium]